MLTFIVPLQSPKVSKDWSKVESLAQRTIHSLCSQKNPDYNVILICNKRPALKQNYRNLHILEKDFPIPSKENRMRDKFLKIQAGLVFIKERLARTVFVMIVDADDLISNRVAGFVQNQTDVLSGFHFQKGYLYSDKHDNFQRIENVNRICGSTYAVRIKIGELPSDITEPCDHPIIKNGHTTIDTFYKDKNTPLITVPFRAVAYVTDTSENDSEVTIFPDSRRKILKGFFKRVMFTKEIRREFSISP